MKIFLVITLFSLILFPTLLIMFVGWAEHVKSWFSGGIGLALYLSTIGLAGFSIGKIDP